MHRVVRTSSNLIEPGEDISKFSHEEIQSRIYGSKLVLVVEQMQILTIWLIKACLLIMYRRMTLVLPQRKIVIGTAIYVAIAFVCITLQCDIFSNPGPRLLWSCSTSPCGAGRLTSTGLSQQIPVGCVSHRFHLVLNGVEQCSAATNHLITNAVFNISSDLIILSIPLPLLFRVRLPKKNKAILLSVFLIGAFTYVY
jgi:hypothetical protein